MIGLSVARIGALVAANLLITEQRELLSTLPPPKGSGKATKSMNRESQARFVAVLLFLLTVAAVVFAGFNFVKERQSAVPDDGVWWVEHDGKLVADRVDPHGMGAQAGIKPNDRVRLEMPVVAEVHTVQEAIVTIPIASKPISGNWKAVLGTSDGYGTEIERAFCAIERKCRGDICGLQLDMQHFSRAYSNRN